MIFPQKDQSSPWPEQLRPQTLEDLVGQEHLLGEGQPIQLILETGIPHSMVLWGPPGVGKTTLAHIIARACDSKLISLSAVFSGVKDIRQAVEQARSNQDDGHSTLLFIDEIRRFNKSQQDALLPFVESGLVTLIGATTENPSFELNRALLSRCQVYVLKNLQETALSEVFKRALKMKAPELYFDADAMKQLFLYADGDARRLLRTLEQIAHSGKRSIDVSWLNSFLQEQIHRFDRSGDYFYDQISALHKSVRGSHPDAALYWLCRMLDGGVDPRYLARRIVRIAWEDIGLADPRALEIANLAATTYERLGSPEGELALAQAVLYLAVAAKSNAGYMAYKQARSFVQHDQSREVPLHLRNAPTELMKKQNYGTHYRYAHDEPHAYAAGETYLPEGMFPPEWYRPVDRGLESKIKQKMEFLHLLDEQARQS